MLRACEVVACHIERESAFFAEYIHKLGLATQLGQHHAYRVAAPALRHRQR